MILIKQFEVLMMSDENTVYTYTISEAYAAKKGDEKWGEFCIFSFNFHQIEFTLNFRSVGVGCSWNCMLHMHSRDILTVFTARQLHNGHIIERSIEHFGQQRFDHLANSFALIARHEGRELFIICNEFDYVIFYFR